MNTVEEGKTTAIISYLTIIGAVIAITINNEKKNYFASFHIRQALGISLTFFLLGYLVGHLDSWTATIAFYIFFLIMWIYGFFGAVTGQMNVVPVVGPYFQKWFKGL